MLVPGCKLILGPAAEPTPSLPILSALCVGAAPTDITPAVFGGGATLAGNPFAVGNGAAVAIALGTEETAGGAEAVAIAVAVAEAKAPL
mmetsp:Transcript_11800/g.23778  ORF Transcript_11800/g.23778 Transcript_11800/m.23778 type:complete len:89 (-) Transcript_11800:1027-1293(-)|eukprot:CAMPEP_0167816308 /NCGR_PEP_ID=MMETSP0112_2-20121227/3523_1 /TAXON_ID=91324 /ORGANISM="Lotharella globosa, Strain CCCM811" /LENGTH=88 /DNA_ID=CAMNT_0007715859 /DNA_START=816 /DNA_END=1082 /DNA_ORIENTATION=-